MPVRPRDAASLVLVRRGPQGAEVLMGRRAGQHRFLPDFYVFPGGRVDPADHQTAPLSHLRPAVAERLARGCSPGRARALAVAAVRETWEETGLALGEIRDSQLLPALDRLDYIVRAITPPESPIRFHARFFLAAADGLAGELGGSGELLDLGWRSIPASLRLPVADITEFVLQEVELHIKNSAQHTEIPIFSYRSGKASIRR